MNEKDIILSDILSVLGDDDIASNTDININKKTVYIPEYKVDDFIKHIEKINKRALKYDIDPIQLTLIDKDELTIKDEHIYGGEITILRNIYDAIMPKSTIMVNGWTVIGVVDTSSNVPIVHNFTDYEKVPEEYISLDIVCEHCYKHRKRTKAFIMKSEDGEYKSVGGSCLKDFTGHDILKNYEYLDIVNDLFNQYEDEDKDDFNAHKEYWRYPINSLVAYSIYIIEQHGYVSSKDSGIKNIESTKSLVMRSIANGIDRIDHKYFIKAEEIIQWFKDNYSKLPNNDYIYNLNSILNNTNVRLKLIGYVISFYAFYLNQIKREEVEKNKNANNNTNYEYYGNEGDKFSVSNIRIKDIISGESSFGPYIIAIMTDQNNHMFVWNTNPKTFNKNVSTDDIYKKTFANLSGTIKEHKIYNGKFQTIVTRCKIVE
jgi:hypothetical protein